MKGYRSKRQPLTLYSGQFALSTQLITLNFPIISSAEFNDILSGSGKNVI